MNPVRLALRRLRALFRRNRLDADMSEEVRHHLELLTEAALARGLSPREARFAALREFGGVEQIKEQARDQRGWRWLEDFRQDLRIGVRALTRERGFSVICILVLALGIGANTAIFSVVDTVVLRPLPVPAPEQIARVWSAHAARNVTSFSVSYQDYSDWAQRSRSWETLASLDNRNVTLLAGGEPERLLARLSTWNALPLFGWQVALGRAFISEDDQRGHGDVAILSDALWRRRFNADPGVLGTAIAIDGRSKTIVGVMAPGRGLTDQSDIYLPLHPFASPSRSDRDLEVYGRLKAGVTLAQAQAEMAIVAQEIEREQPGTNAGWSTRLEPYFDVIVGRDMRTVLWLVLGAVAVLLAISCTNFSSLLLVRAAKRSHELAIRAALGGGRSRLVRQLTAESLLLAALGGAAGLTLAAWSVEFIRTLEGVGLPRASEVVLDLRVLSFGLLATLLTGLAAGILPALAASRIDLQHGLKGSDPVPGRSRHRLRNALVVSQLALSIVLLMVAGVLARSFDRLRETDLGFRPEQVLTARIGQVDGRKALIEDYIDRVRSLPNVRAVGIINSAPMSGYNTGNAVFPVGEAAIPATKSVQCEWRIVSEDYFRAMQIALVRGRTFTRADDASKGRVVVVNQALARQLWGDADPIGKQINPGGGTAHSTVIGVVGDIRSRDPALAPRPGYYLSAHRSVWGAMTLTVRVEGDVYALVPQLRAELKALAPTLPLFDIQTMDELVGRQLAPERTVTILLSAFAVLALALAVTGLYGVMAHATGQRTREVGIRIALGAQPRDVVLPIVAHGARLIAAGSLLGIALAFVVARLLSGQFAELRAVDPIALTGAALLLASVSVLACYLPARRASRLDPLVALRNE